ncbi:sugar ABC transporter ATP-binding protein [Lichenifustis flavocetrariae]|uniref:Sugar ABC transporter ATP-binding protein n=1 Tax=Lichenifustis flavocetrariae TaxID=2949735 RepID=A0AA41Z475_9HYPH|nr:sugar ABC transporter ATP-binding protein [Lichenifustis flavocetrariae]MCW6510178.1 sugar ABC transporter ATP-binding protein [Lichenifustis flavocetrariae]
MTAALQARHVSKTFGGNRVLDDVSLAIEPGEVHGLLGQNGSGKSTLIKILAGYQDADPGAELLIGGHRVALPLPSGQSQSLGISTVHQHLALIPSLSVVENMLLGRLGRSNAMALSWRKARAECAAVFQRYGLEIDPAATVSGLSAIERAMVAIVRAVEDLGLRSSGSGPGVLILDEPTPFLPKQDVETLFALVRRIVARGASVLFVSHDIDEVREITDRATVLRDGRLAGTIDTKASSRDEIIKLIIGRALRADRPASEVAQGAPAKVAVTGLSGGGVKGVDFDLQPGEILGLTGLLGSGFESVVYMLYGAIPRTTGTLRIEDETTPLAEATPARSIAAGTVLIPGDRNARAAIGILPIADNVTMPVLSRKLNKWFVRRGPMHQLAQDLGRQFGVVPNRPEQPLSSLSGGNAQKVVIAKWLQTDPRLILLDEPTQGVDVGARELVFDAIRGATRKGAAVICASSDYEQLAMLCDRVLVFADGRVGAELNGEQISKQSIAETCLRGASKLPDAL